MKMKRILFISLILALMLSLVLPSVAMAAKPAVFSAQGTMTGIDDGTTKQLGHSGLWLVKDRHIDGVLAGDLTGNFKITYGGVFALPSQKGNLSGRMVVGQKVFEINGSVDPLTMLPSGAPMLTIHGHWTGLKGIRATGTFNAYMVFIPDATGHVVKILDSAFVMTGKYVR
jgi:hypothetical protein